MWRSTNNLLNYKKDVCGVKDTQLCSFKHVRCRGVAAKAGSVHLLSELPFNVIMKYCDVGVMFLKNAEPDINV